MPLNFLSPFQLSEIDRLGPLHRTCRRRGARQRCHAAHAVLRCLDGRVALNLCVALLEQQLDAEARVEEARALRVHVHVRGAQHEHVRVLHLWESAPLGVGVRVQSREVSAAPPPEGSVASGCAPTCEVWNAAVKMGASLAPPRWKHSSTTSPATVRRTSTLISGTSSCSRRVRL